MSDRNYYHQHHRSSTRAMPMPMVPMPMPSRAKSVTDPLDDRVKARLIRPDSAGAGEGYASSSGSEHEGLSGVLRIDGFFFDDADEEDADRRGQQLEDDDAGWSGDDKEDEEDDDDSNGKSIRRSSRGSASGSGKASSPSPFGSLSKHSAAVIRDMMRASSSPALVKDPFRRDLLSAVLSAVQRNRKQHDSTRSSSCDGGDKAAFRRAVMYTLRDAGHNAGVCKSRWAASSGVTAGTYEYIDVVRPATSLLAPVERYIVDVGFAGEFEIARPTEEYARVAAELPAVYVGRPDDLKPALRVLADAAKRSLRDTGMHVPPWRKLRYVLAKWLGPYKRTINAEPASAGAAASFSNAATPAPQRFPATEAVQCRAVGFQQPAMFAPAPAPIKLPATSAVHCRAVGFQQPAPFTIAPALGRTR